MNTQGIAGFKVSMVLGVLSIFLFSCGDSVQLQPVDKVGTILAFGDSLTAGVGATPQTSYPAVLENLSGVRVVNAGISGETSDLALKRLPGELKRVSPDLMILLMGGNDILQNKSYVEIKENLRGIIRHARRKKVSLVLIGVPEKKLFSSTAPIYEELANEYQLVFEPDLIGKLLRSPAMKSDPVHFNKAGYQKMAEEIYALLRDRGALE